MSYPSLPPDEATLENVKKMLDTGNWFYPFDGQHPIFKSTETGKYVVSTPEKIYEFDTVEQVAIFTTFAGCEYV